MSNVVIDTFRARDVWATEPDWRVEPRESLQSNVDLWQSRDDVERYANQNYASSALAFGYLFWNRTQIGAMRDFFDEKMGRLYPFWVPTWREDVIVDASFSAVDTTLSIEDNGYHDYWGANEFDGRFLMFLFPDGTRIYRKVLYSISNTLIVVDPPLGKACSTDELANLMVSFLHLSRFAVDELEMRFQAQDVCEVALTFIFIPQETPSTTSTTTTSSSSTTTTSSTLSTTSSTASTTSSTLSTTSSTVTTTSSSSSSSTTTTAV